MPELKINATIVLTPDHVKEAIHYWLREMQGITPIEGNTRFCCSTRYEGDQRDGMSVPYLKEVQVTIDPGIKK